MIFAVLSIRAALPGSDQDMHDASHAFLVFLMVLKCSSAVIKASARQSQKRSSLPAIPRNVISVPDVEEEALL